MEQFNADAYTLKAEVHLRRVEENEQLQQAIKDGNQKIFNEIMENSVKYKLTWGDHIKRYIFDCISDGNMKIEEITREQVVEFIKKAFADNGMKNRGSMDPKGSTTLGSQLEKWLESPVTKISRETCFLFCFGLNMDEDGAAYMLEVLRKATFNPRDYKEAIYYYCLCNNLQYAGVVRWLNKYEELSMDKPAEGSVRNSDTIVLENKLKTIASLATEKDFLEYLSILKRMPVNNKKSKTRADILKRHCEEFYQCQSDSCEKLDEDLKLLTDIHRAETKSQIMFKKKLLNRTLFLEGDFTCKKLEECLLRVKTDEVKVPAVFEQMVKEKLIELPTFTVKSLEKKIGSERSIEINREDILMIVFLLCSLGMGDDFVEEGGYDYRKRKAEFVYEANLSLEKCGFGDVYLLNPFELFLVSCLLQPKPMEYFLAVWKQFR